MCQRSFDWANANGGFLCHPLRGSKMPFRSNLMYRQGITAGFIGATAVAAWFLIVDTIAGRPFFTPSLLGHSLISAFDRSQVSAGDSEPLTILVYTLFHYGAFFIVGIIVTLMVQLAESQPSILGGFFILFIAFELGFQGLVAMLQHTTALGALAWYQIMLGNIIASLAMGTYIWRTHPELREGVRHALDGVGE